MSRDSKLFITDILDSCAKIADYTAGLSADEFFSDIKTTDAVVRNLEIIGEAVKNIPADLLTVHSEIDWKNVARFRDIIAHHYFKVKVSVVWDIVEHELKPLERAAKDILAVLTTEQG